MARLEALAGRGAAARLTLRDATGVEQELLLDAAGLRELTAVLSSGEQRAAVYRLVRQARLAVHPHDRLLAAIADTARLFGID